MAARYLPGATEGPWRSSAYPATGLGQQGWKIHVSATVLNAAEVLEIIGPILVREAVAFKGVASLDELIKLNCGLYYGYSQIGKAFTVYPASGESAVRIAQLLAHALEGQPGPAVPFEARTVEDCPVFVRYGLFIADGESDAKLIGPDGVEEPDRRDMNPRWAVPPEGLLAPARHKPRGPLSTSYLAYGSISQRGKGGVYRALDLATSPARRCVLKEGRRHGETDPDGNDGFSRVRQEVETLRELASRGVPVPQVYASFEQGGNQYVALEWMPGGSLAELIFAENAAPVDVGEVLRRCVKVTRLVAQVHRCGWVWRDLKAANILIDAQNELRPIDFEGAALQGDVVTSPWGSPGHLPPEWRTSLRASAEQDNYALGVVMQQILTGDLRLDGQGGATVGDSRPDTPTALERLISDLTHKEPETRPTAEAALKVLQATQSSLGRHDRPQLGAYAQ